ncbi:MAG TPA: cytochrome P460 family protein, partial [Pyrinomonadaceae bacterium]|nr:cytochrome P460 family protein [Pyrinomonadaceae bacterium]
FLGGVLALSALPHLLDPARAAAGDKPARTNGTGGRQPAQADTSGGCPNVPTTRLPLPSAFLPACLPQFQERLAQFLESQQYKHLGWAEDKGVRDTGPFVNNTSYGVHPAVRIYYSPEVFRWLKGGRKGTIPDGAMIVKEQWPSPAGRYRFNEPPEVADWTVMIKDAKGSADGWYWAEIWRKQCADNNEPPFAVRNAGFGLYCVRCHSTAEKELTFSSLTNIKGQPGEPLAYYDDNSWFYAPTPAPTPTPTPPPPCRETGGRTDYSPPVRHDPGKSDEEVHQERARLAAAPAHAVTLNQKFVAFYNSIKPVNDPQRLPGESYDHVWARPAAPGKPTTNLFLTSDSCMGCHSAITYGGNPMLYEGLLQPDGTTPAMNVSPFAEWRWSPMGLAGRDPIFHAQLDSEIAYLKTRPDADEMIRKVTNTCFKCHGVMGKRTLDADHGGVDKGDFKREFVYLTDEKDPNFKYGALARDGISCMACHRIVQDKPQTLSHFLEKAITGEFSIGKPDELYGPFKDDEIVTDPMNNSLGIKPKHDPYIKSSRMCGSCHTINLPVVDWKPPGGNENKAEGPRPVTHSSLEQLTYLEWLNSGYQNEFNPGPKAQTCQECHMRPSYSNSKGTLRVPLIQQPIAAVEDDRYPATEGRLPAEKTHVRLRESGFARHQLQGLNIPLLEMFRQYMQKGYANGANLLSNPILGVRQNDYMQSVADNLPNAIDAMVEQAANSTADINLAPFKVVGGKLTAEVLVTNKTGHRFPSGVGFRRGFLELRVVDTTGGQEKTVWCSGCTDELGVITNGDGGRPLPSELYETYQSGQKPQRSDYPAPCQNVTQQQYQPHFWGARFPITRQDQAQIYEEIDLNADCRITSSFIRRDFVIKDNRLLPFGWTATGPLGPDGKPVIPKKEFLEPTHAEKVWGDPRYTDGSGTNLVRYELSLPAGVNPNNLRVSATLYYQSIPPHYLHDRFSQAPDYPATRRLYYLTSNLRTQGTPMENWKVKVVAASRTAGQ